MIKKTLIDAVKIFFDRRLFVLLCLGFSSGLPYLLTATTLGYWLAETGVSKTQIGLFGLVATPYALKFLWSPFLDQLSLPYLTKRLGKRKSWGMVSQAGLALSLLGMSGCDPAVDLKQIAIYAIMVAFFSASQDVVIDAYRIESLKSEEQGAGSAVATFGYRMGMIMAGAGALYTAHFFSWQMVYWVMAGLIGVGFVTLLVSPEPVHQKAHQTHGFGEWVAHAVFDPFKDFMMRPHWILILVLIFVYKGGAILTAMMAQPFYIELGFTKVEIAHVMKVLGVIATIGGGFVGGLVVARYGILKALLMCSFFQMLTNGMFIWLYSAGHDLSVFSVSVVIENIAIGMESVALIAFMSSLCSQEYTATQYALFSSFYGIARDLLGSVSGILADQMDWQSFFVVAIVLTLPGLWMVFWMIQKDFSFEKSV